MRKLYMSGSFAQKTTVEVSVDTVRSWLDAISEQGTPSEFLDLQETLSYLTPATLAAIHVELCEHGVFSSMIWRAGDSASGNRFHEYVEAVRTKLTDSKILPHG